MEQLTVCFFNQNLFSVALDPLQLGVFFGSIRVHSGPQWPTRGHGGPLLLMLVDHFVCRHFVCRFTSRRLNSCFFKKSSNPTFAYGGNEAIRRFNEVFLKTKVRFVVHRLECYYPMSAACASNKSIHYRGEKVMSTKVEATKVVSTTLMLNAKTW